MNYHGKPKKLGKPCMVRINGDTRWLSAVWTGSQRARITANDPIWRGAQVTVADAKIRHLHPTEDQ